MQASELPTNKILSTALLFSLISICLLYLYSAQLIFIWQRTVDNLFNALSFIVVVVYLIYRQRDQLVVSNIKPEIIIGFSGLIISVALIFIGTHLNSLWLQLASVGLMVSSLFLLFLGRKITKISFLPLILLSFPAIILERILLNSSWNLQIVSATLSTFILDAANIPVVQHGIHLYLPWIHLRIDPSCNGIQHITSLVILAIFLTIIFHLHKRKGVLLAIIAGFLALFLNALRISFIGIWALFFQGDLLHGPGNFFYVAFIFTFGAFALIVIATRWDKSHKEIRNLNLEILNNSEIINLKSEFRNGFDFRLYQKIQVITLGILVFAVIINHFV